MRMALTGRHERHGPTSWHPEPGRRASSASSLCREIANSPSAATTATAGAQELADVPSAPSSCMWGHPDQTKARALVERAPLGPARDLHRKADAVQYSSFELPDRGAARAGRLVGQQPARPAQRDDRPHARRVRGGVEGARRRSRGPRDRAHRRGPRVPDRRRRGRDRDRRHRHAALPGVGRAAGTCTSPRGTSRCGSR